MEIEWVPGAVQAMEAHARKGLSQAMEIGRALELINEGARGGWSEFEQVEDALSQGRCLRFFEAGRLTVIVQVMPPVKLRVAAAGVSTSHRQFRDLVASVV